MHVLNTTFRKGVKDSLLPGNLHLKQLDPDQTNISVQTIYLYYFVY